MFIQIPFYVKKIIQKVLAIPNVMVRGMFVGPDIMAPIQPGDLNRQAVYVNAYACLKELNAFYFMPKVFKAIAAFSEKTQRRLFVLLNNQERPVPKPKNPSTVQYKLKDYFSDNY